MGETEDIKPIIVSSAPVAWAKRGKTGFFEMVVENIAKKPINERCQMSRRSDS